MWISGTRPYEFCLASKTAGSRGSGMFQKLHTVNQCEDASCRHECKCSTQAQTGPRACLPSPASGGQVLPSAVTAAEAGHLQRLPCIRSCLVRPRCAPAGPGPHLCWRAFAFLLGPPSARACSAYCPGSLLPRCTCPRLILCCTCPPMCIWARWPMPACVWRDVQSVSVFYLTFVFSVT